MSIAVLDGLDTENEAHNYYHDLESLFYVLVWTCITQEGPNGVARLFSDFDYKGSPVDVWCNIKNISEATLQSIARQKRGTMSSWPAFNKDAFIYMEKYFAPLRFLFYWMREILFRTSPDLKFVSAKSLADIPDDQKHMRDRERTKVFAEIKSLLDKVLDAKEIQDEAAGIEGMDSTELQQEGSGSASGVDSVWRAARVDRLPQGDKENRSEKLARQAMSLSKTIQNVEKRARDQTNIAADEACPLTQTRSLKRLKAD